MCKMFLSFSTDVYVIFLYWNILMKWMHFILICHILLLIIYWCWLFFMCKMFLSFLTDVYMIFCFWNILMKWMDFIFICHLLMLTYFLCGKYSTISILLFDYLLMLTYFSCAKCIYHSRLMFMWFSVTETYRWSGWTSSSFVIDIFLCGKYFTISNTAFDYLLMLTYFSCANFLIILDWCLCDFLLLKHIDEVDGLHLHLSLTYFCVENILWFQYCFWLFTDVDIFFMCKMFLSFLTDVYVIFCYWKISMKWMDFIFICHLLMLTYFLCGKYSTISILLLIIYWCWHIFYVQNVLIILDWCLCDFLLLKDIDESGWTSSSFVIYWCWHIFVLKMSHNFNIVFDYLLMLIIFPVQNVLIMFSSYSRISILLFDYLLMLTIFHVPKFP